MNMKAIFIGLTRISLGWTFLWAFFDKLIGLGFTTCRMDDGSVVKMCEKAWMSGGSPTSGFLKFGTHGPLAEFFQSLAGSAFVDWLFMLGLLGVGIGLLFGILTRLSIFSGVFMMALMYLAAMPPEHNPITDDHMIYAFVLLSFLFIPAHEYLGLGKKWAVYTKNNPWLN